MKRLRAEFRDEARMDLKEIHAWYQKQRKGLGGEFRAEFREKLALVRQQPGMGRELAPGVRRMLLNRFPYLFVYRPLEGYLIVEGVLHQRRDPKMWQERMTRTG